MSVWTSTSPCKHKVVYNYYVFSNTLKYIFVIILLLYFIFGGLPKIFWKPFERLTLKNLLNNKNIKIFLWKYFHKSFLLIFNGCCCCSQLCHCRVMVQLEWVVKPFWPPEMMYLMVKVHAVLLAHPRLRGTDGNRTWRAEAGPTPPSPTTSSSSPPSPPRWRRICIAQHCSPPVEWE